MSKTVRSQVDAVLAAAGVKKGKQGGQGKKSKKIGRYNRHPSSCRYRAERRWERNQLRRVRRHLRSQPGDRTAREWLAANGTGDDARMLSKLPA